MDVTGCHKPRMDVYVLLWSSHCCRPQVSMQWLTVCTYRICKTCRLRQVTANWVHKSFTNCQYSVPSRNASYVLMCAGLQR